MVAILDLPLFVFVPVAIGKEYFAMAEKKICKDKVVVKKFACFKNKS